jgi:hypothetical protein
MRFTPQLPLETPEADPEKIIRKGKALHQGTSTIELGIFDDFNYPIGTPISNFQPLVIPYVGVSQTFNFGSVPVEFSPLGLGLEGETIVTPLSLLRSYCGLDPVSQKIFLPWASPLPLLLLLPLPQKEEPQFPQALQLFLQILCCFLFLWEALFQSPPFKPLPLLILLHLISLW